ncbi:MAG: hypothetical protein AAGF47_00825 [Planctomycetota bacterium]
MSTNPYAAHPEPPPASDFGSDFPSEPARTSVLAILSLLFSLVCFIPGLSTLGSVLGVFAIIGIAKSRGRVKGTGLAVAGVVVGLLVTVLWIGLAIGTSQALQQYAGLGVVVAKIQDGDEAAVRSELAQATRDALTSADIEAFRAAYQADAGSYTGVPAGIGPLIGAFADLGSAGQQPDPSKIPYDNPAPLPGQFDNGARLMWFAFSTQQQNDAGTTAAIVNVGIELGDGTLLWLIDPERLRGGAASDPSAATETETETETETGSGTEPGTDGAAAPGGGG